MPSAPVLPQTAVLTDDKGSYVLIVERATTRSSGARCACAEWCETA